MILTKTKQEFTGDFFIVDFWYFNNKKQVMADEYAAVKRGKLILKGDKSK